jgi:hypothetical protein
MKILLDLNAKMGGENIFKPTIGNESLLQDSNDNGVRIVNFATSKNLVINTLRMGHLNFLNAGSRALFNVNQLLYCVS